MLDTASGVIANDDDLPVFARHGLDRAGLLREDSSWLDERLHAPTTRFLPLWMFKGRFRLEPRPALGWVEREFVNEALESGATCVFLGLDGGAARFAIDLGDGKKGDLPPALLEGAKFVDVRMMAGSLPAGDAGIIAQARALLSWHRFHQFCGRCGGKTVAHPDGYARRCSNTACNSDHFPRTDPVTIMMVTRKDANGEDQILLGRQPVFPAGVWSCLAGFVESGESLEDAARREVMEEAGINGGKVTYMASQPWPYPSSLMIGMHVEALSDNLVIDHNELEDARWFTRVEVLEMRERARNPETFIKPDASKPTLPTLVSLAWFITDQWLEETA